MQSEATVSQDSLPAIVESIFSSDAVDVCEAYSAYGAEVVYFENPQALLTYIQDRIGKTKHFGFAVYYPETGGFVEKAKIALDPKKCDGHTLRYRVSGWGVIQFQLEFANTPLFKCRFAVNSESRAGKWFDTTPELKSPSLWNWKLVDQHARRLIRELKKHAQLVG